MLASRIGHRLESVKAVVELNRLRFFHTAIGESNPSLVDGQLNSNRLPIPPTYLFCLEMMNAENPFAFVEGIGVSISKILHADQHFRYYAPVFVGDMLTFSGHLSDVFEKRGGELTFLVQKVAVTNQDEITVAEIERTFVIKERRSAT